MFALFMKIIFNFMILIALSNTFVWMVVDIYKHNIPLNDIKVYIATGLFVLLFSLVFLIPGFFFFLISSLFFTAFLIWTLGFGKFNWLMIRSKEYTKEIMKMVMKKIM